MSLGRIFRFDWRSALIAAPFAVLLSMLVNSVLDRDPPIYYVEASALQASVPAGGTISIRFDVDRKRVCQVQNIYRYITDKDGVNYGGLTYTAEAATRPGKEVYNRAITVPEAVPPGKASYFIRIRYECNFIHRLLGWPIVVESPKVDFMVTPKQGEVRQSALMIPLPIAFMMPP